MSEKPLTPKQVRFVEEYLIDLNATAAYKRAGYKVKTDEAAGAAAARLLGDVRVQAAVQERRRALSEAAAVDAVWVLRKLVTNAERAAQAEPVRDSDGKETGEYRYEGSVVNRALELIGKHLGMFEEVVKHKHGGDPGNPMQHEYRVSVSERIARLEGAFIAAARRVTGEGALSENGRGKPVDSSPG